MSHKNSNIVNIFVKNNNKEKYVEKNNQNLLIKQKLFV